MENTTIILGAGFSDEASVPITSKISGDFLGAPENSRTPEDINDRITEYLERFWEDVFGYSNGCVPTFEDHFTMLDLAANSGHNLGKDYTPAQLRAIRRMSIHRVFDILNTFDESPYLRRFCSVVSQGDNTMVSLNWDLVVENHWPDGDGGQGLHYGIDTLILGTAGREFNREGVSLIKVHGSSNWHYCDSCQRIVAGHPGTGKTALTFFTYLQADDFRKLSDNPDNDPVINRVRQLESPYEPECPVCGTPLSGRVGTFSYRKGLDFLPFHALWGQALDALVRSRTWVFLGYSLPASDYEFRHLLKSAELARGAEYKPQIEVVLLDGEDAEGRFRQFFGDAIADVDQQGIEAWILDAEF